MNSGLLAQPGQAKILLGIVAATEAHAAYNSTAFVSSTAARVTLAPGTYFIESRAVVSDSLAASSNPQCQLGFTGTASYSGGGIIGNGGAGDPPSFPAYLGFTAGSANTIFPMLFAAGTGQDLMRFLKIVVTVAGDLTIDIAQQIATSSTLSLYVGSYLKATPIG